MLYSHLLSSRIHEETIRKSHDPTNVPGIKEFSFENSGYIAPVDQRQFIKNEADKSVSIKVKEDFKNLDNLKSLMRAVRAWRTVIYCIRSYDYGPTVVANLLEDTCFLAGIFKNNYRNQRLCLESFVNAAIRQNNNRYKLF